MSDPTNTQGTPGADEEADVASGGPADPPTPDTAAPASDEEATADEETRKTLDRETTDSDGTPLENPSGG